MGHSPQYGWDFLDQIRKNAGKTPETLSELSLEFPSRVQLLSPKAYKSRHVRLPEHFQNSFPLSRAGDASFFIRRILAPIKIKSALPLPPQKTKTPPPHKKNEEFYGHESFPAERTQIFQAPIKFAQPFPAPELRAKHLTDTRFFLILPFPPKSRVILAAPFPNHF